MPPTSTVIEREIRTIRTSFNKLARSFGRIAPLLAAGSITVSAEGQAGERRPRRKPRLTPKHRRALKLQGKYMGTMRGLSVTQRAKVKKIRSAKGIRAAIAEARRLSK